LARGGRSPVHRLLAGRFQADRGDFLCHPASLVDTYFIGFGPFLVLVGNEAHADFSVDGVHQAVPGPD